MSVMVRHTYMQSNTDTCVQPPAAQLPATQLVPHCNLHRFLRSPLKLIP